ncbi:MAG: Gfo/Idh/MocA family oxidoreductase [Acidimicrobiia bacterium]|nr:Gfo/Idh/MocA family oxidoreductase [Acidimicrobiia bacterium]MBT8216894.1 Gfo/Idh/MocA family oxidoreductase [Acidimicrobiia bacterium]NNF10459.1 Gfo/Idh/MocA family oxidoreductase [Acidimicrobiia bacterium]NNL68797.1 Gfo/Idh/MocA family oxidoreductase [Acidimicrobiia bacterium]
MSPLAIGLVGAGGIGSTYVEVLGQLDEAGLAVVCDLDRDLGTSVAAANGAVFTDDYRSLAGVDAVIIATPPATHPDVARRFLRDGIPVLCEKPLAIDIPSARSMVEEARRSDTILTMASKFRYVPDISTARSFIRSGTIGEVVLYENTFASRVDMTDRWNAVSEISGGGVLIDNGTHSLDIARYLLGPIAQVLAIEGHRVQDVAVEDTARIFFTTEDSVAGTIDLSWSVNKERDSFIEIYGSEGVIKIGWNASSYRLDAADEWVQFGHGYDKLEAMTAQVRNFVGAVNGTERLLIEAADGIASVAVVEAAYASLNSPNWIVVAQETDTDRVVA